MINPRYMRDQELIAEYQGWLIAATNLDGASFSPGTPLGNRWNDVRREFNARMEHDLPRPGTKEEIEEEQERAQRVAARMSTPKKPTANDTGYVQSLEFTLKGKSDAV